MTAIPLNKEFDRQLAAAIAAVKNREAFDDLDVWLAMPLARLKNNWRCRRRPSHVTRYILAYLTAQPDLVRDAQGWWHCSRQPSEGSTAQDIFNNNGRNP